MQIPEKLYAKIVKCLPIICVDVIVRSEGRIMLVRRKNEPLGGEWWLPGGRVEHGESAVDAVRRKVRADLGIEILHPRAIGYTDQFFERSAFGEDPYHTISIVFEAEAASVSVRLGPENADWRFSDDVPGQLLQQMTRFTDL